MKLISRIEEIISQPANPVLFSALQKKLQADILAAAEDGYMSMTFSTVGLEVPKMRRALTRWLEGEGLTVVSWSEHQQQLQVSW